MPWWSSRLQKLRDKRDRVYKIFTKTNCEQHLIQCKKIRAKFKTLAKKNKKEDRDFFYNLAEAYTIK